MKIELKGKEVIAIIGLICLTILIALGYNEILMMLFAGAFAAYAGIDRLVEVRKKKK